jgi:5-methylcytosine-specific restriction protein A
MTGLMSNQPPLPPPRAGAELLTRSTAAALAETITMNERIRGRAGQRLRLRRLRAEPLCRDCAARGVIRRSTVPDHIRPLALGGLDVDENVRCLCDDCHLFRTAQQFGHRGGRLLGDDGWPIE